MDFTSISSRYRYVDTLISRTSAGVAKSVAALSSGKRITQASDDVASLSIATKLRSHVTTIRSSLTSLAQADSLLQIMDGALNETGNILQRLNAVITMANSGAISDAERGFLQIEVDGLVKEIDRILGETNFNGVSLFGSGYRTPQAPTPEADIASFYDVRGKESGIYSVRAGDTVFNTYVETIGEGSAQENWLLIGRGRDGWEFDDDGQGDTAYLANGLGTVTAFDPVALDSASINALLDANGLQLDDIEIRIKRAANEGGTEYQELRQRPLGPAQWSWQFDKVDYSTEYEAKSSSLGGTFTDAVSSMSDTTQTLGADSGDDYQRQLTNADPNIDINGGVRGFQYGAAVAGTMGTSNASFFWDSGAAGHAMPYTEVYIRVKDIAIRHTNAQADEFVDPRSIKGLELWLDANDLDGDGTSEGLNESGQVGGNVTVWRDKSGNDADVYAATGNGPTTAARTINNINALDFDGTEALVNLANAADLYGDDYTWYVVAEDDAQVDDDFLLYANANITPGIAPTGMYDGYTHPTIEVETHLGFGDATSDSILLQMNGPLGNVSRVVTSPNLRNPVQILGAEWKVGEYAVAYMDGYSATTFTVGQVSQIRGTTQTPTTFIIGAHGSSTANLNRWHDGAIAEVIVVSNNMSTDERQRLEGYLAQKWGLSDNLPDYQLYKSASPGKALQMRISDAYDNKGTVGNVNVNDFKNVSYSVAGAYKDIFSVNAQTGEIRVMDPGKLLDIQSESIRLTIMIEGEGVGDSAFFMPVQIALDKRFLGFDVLDATDRKLYVSVDHFNSRILFDNRSITVLSQDDTASAAALVLAAIDKTTSFRAEVGAKQSSVNILTEYNAQALRNQDEARGVVEDTDVATASTELAMNTVKNNMAVAIAAQATQLQTEVAESVFEAIDNR